MTKVVAVCAMMFDEIGSDLPSSRIVLAIALNPWPVISSLLKPMQRSAYDAG